MVQFFYYINGFTYPKPKQFNVGLIRAFWMVPKMTNVEVSNIGTIGFEVGDGEAASAE